MGIRRGFRQAVTATSLYSVLFVGPVMFLLSPWLAERLTETALTARYTQLALLSVPAACLVSIAFLLCRPVFEAMQQGRPGLVMALLRYLVLTAPLAWLGMTVARSLGRPELYGLIVGTLLAAAISSVVFWVWLNHTLQREVRRQAP